MWHVSCNQCQVLVINNVICHELGCPDEWRDRDEKCKWCGMLFRPEQHGQRFCCDSCAESYCS